jgi:hypothetical protein
MARVKFEKERDERIEAKKNYYSEKAEKLQTKSIDKCNEALEMAKVIPFGQPIHIGHHSEKSDRNYRKRIDNKMGQSILLQKKSDYYSNKAQTNDTSIHSLDEKADEKIQNKIDQLTFELERMKALNKIFKKITNHDEFEDFINDSKNSKDDILAVFEQREYTLKFHEPRAYIYPFTYSITNTGAEIRRLKKRLKIIKIQDERPCFNFCNSFAEIKEEDSRFNIYFKSIPKEETRTRLKKEAMKWSPSRKSWTRQITTSTNSKRLFQSLVDILESIQG